MHNVLGSISTKIGIPPLYSTACAVLTNDREGKITSFPLIFDTLAAKCNAAVPLFTVIHALELTNFLNFFSNSLTRSEPAPDAQKPLLNVFTISLISFFSITGSNNFIFFIIFYH